MRIPFFVTLWGLSPKCDILLLFNKICQCYGKTSRPQNCLVKRIGVCSDFNYYSAGGKLLIESLLPEVYRAAKIGVEGKCMSLKLRCKAHIFIPVVVGKTALVTSDNKHYFCCGLSVNSGGVLDFFPVFADDGVAVNIKHYFD